jgi:hypothetical protein
MPREQLKARVDSRIMGCVENTAKVLGTTVTWVVESTLFDRFHDQLDPESRPGKPTKDWGEEDAN